MREEQITEQIEKCLQLVHEMLECLGAEGRWLIRHGKTDQYDIDDWKKEYLGLIDGEDYFFVYFNHVLLYAVNVTGDSVLTAIQELIDLLARKF